VSAPFNKPFIELTDAELEELEVEVTSAGLVRELVRFSDRHHLLRCILYWKERADHWRAADEAARYRT
jgi:hypothetical protein